jgi:hypothetical protein
VVVVVGMAAGLRPVLGLWYEGKSAIRHPIKTTAGMTMFTMGSFKKCAHAKRSVDMTLISIQNYMFPNKASARQMSDSRSTTVSVMLFWNATERVVLRRFAIQAAPPRSRARTNMIILNAHKKMVDTVAFMPDGRALASMGRDPAVKMWDLTNGKAVWEAQPTRPAWMVGMTVSPNGKWVAAWEKHEGCRFATREAGKRGPFFPYKVMGSTVQRQLLPSRLTREVSSCPV